MFRNRHSMKRYIQHGCENIFSLIRKKTENVLMLLMLDSASRYGRDASGVSGRYIKDGEIFFVALILDPRFCFTSGHQLFNAEMLNRGITQLIKIHQKRCTRREQSNSSSAEEYIQLNASYSSNTSEEMILMNSEDVEAEKVRRFIEYIGGATRQGIINAS